MIPYYFLSYSKVDGKDFAFRLRESLPNGLPLIGIWMDQYELRPGADWDQQLVEAIRTCEGLLFVMTTDSVMNQSVCKLEWIRALKYKKPVVPLLVHSNAELPFQLGARQYVDATGSFSEALAQIRKYVMWLTSPEGRLETLRDRLGDARRDLMRTSDSHEHARIKKDVAQLIEKIAQLECLLSDPTQEAQRVESSIQQGIEQERRRRRPRRPPRLVYQIDPVPIIHSPPAMIPRHYQGREHETNLLSDFLFDDNRHLVTVTGRGGIGKTTLVCRLLKSLEEGHLPGHRGPFRVNGMVYLSGTGVQGISWPNIFGALTNLLSKKTKQTLSKLFQQTGVEVATIMQAVLDALPPGNIVVLLDNVEDLIDAKTCKFRDPELFAALRFLLERPAHPIKVFMTAPAQPLDLAMIHPGRQSCILLEGLPNPYAENILREMDVDGTVGLKTASEELLTRARERTEGNPRALEILFAILSADRSATLEDILLDTDKLLPEHVVEMLVGEAFSRLDRSEQRVMQALAIYGRPVPPAAVNYLLQHIDTGGDNTSLLRLLVNRQFVRKDRDRFYLLPMDRMYAASRIPAGRPEDREPSPETIFSKYALWDRAARYYEQIRLPQEHWKNLGDLEPQLAEFELRCAGGDFDRAALILEEIDFDYLHTWGHYRLEIELHERVHIHLSDPVRKAKHEMRLGHARWRVGQFQEAVMCYQQALQTARIHHFRKLEGDAIGNLANIYSDVGEFSRAKEYCQQALDISRDEGDVRGEAIWLLNLGNKYGNEGQWCKGIEAYRKALIIARNISHPIIEIRGLTNVGLAYLDLGECHQAQENLNAALTVARSRRDRLGETSCLTYLGAVRLEENDCAGAIKLAEEAMAIAEEMNIPQFQSEIGQLLTEIHIVMGNIQLARKTVDKAKMYDFPLMNHRVCLLAGVVALRHQDLPGAHQAFSQAITSANTLLARSTLNYPAFDSKALAQCGLMVWGKNSGLQSSAIANYQAARSITQDAGIIKQIWRLFEALRMADSNDVLGQFQQSANMPLVLRR